MDRTDEYLRMAFWSLHTDGDPLDEPALRCVSREMQALCEDAVAYWLEYGEAPLLAERVEDDR